MKPKKRLATKMEMNRNLTEARKLLGEKKFYIFTPAEELQIKQGFMAINTSSRTTLLPSIVLIKSRGSFIEIRFDDMLFSPPLLKMIRRTLWVPIFVGKTLYIEDGTLKEFVCKDEHSELDALCLDTKS